MKNLDILVKNHKMGAGYKLKFRKTVYLPPTIRYGRLWYMALTLRWDTSTPGMDGIEGVVVPPPGIQGTASGVNLISAPVIHLHNKS